MVGKSVQENRRHSVHHQRNGRASSAWASRGMGVVIAAVFVCGLALGGKAKGADVVKIAVIDANAAVVKEATGGTLKLDRAYVKGDRIVVTGATHLAVKVDRHYAEAILFAPDKKVDFPIPLWPKGKYPKNYPHPPKAFQGDKHVITARVATEKEMGAYRNLAVNPMDVRGKSRAYPHASSNSEWGEAAVFSAKTAIDGFVEATGDHHKWPRQSWGPYLPDAKHPKPELTIEFGRPVEIDKLAVVVRYNVRQGNHWKEATVEFSDGSKVKVTPKYNGKRQEFPIDKRVATSLKITDLVSEKPGKYAAFVEVEAWGKPAKTKGKGAAGAETLVPVPESQTKLMPPARTRREVDAVLGKAATKGPVRPLHVVLVAGKKDHGPGEHDYPGWQGPWARLLALAPKTKVTTAWDAPSEADLKSADVMVFFKRNAWAKDTNRRMDAYLARGGGVVLFHSAVDGRPNPEAMQEHIGLCWGSGCRFRHGWVELAFDKASDCPIVRGLGGKTLRFYDESYWRLRGDASRIDVLATTVEKEKDGTKVTIPMMWNRRVGKGRVHVNIMGHYNWTFNDPVFRVLAFRAIAWAADESVARFNDIVTVGVTLKG